MLGTAVLENEMFSIEELESVFQLVLEDLGDGKSRDQFDPASISQTLLTLSKFMINAAHYSANESLKIYFNAPKWAQERFEID
jgi:hypothetical protein